MHTFSNGDTSAELKVWPSGGQLGSKSVELKAQMAVQTLFFHRCCHGFSHRRPTKPVGRPP
jgi:hypothetical protein